MARISIERDQNGYVVCATDPKIMAENQKPGSSSHWRDPDREYHFKTCDEACEFVKEIAEKALPLDPPATAAVRKMQFHTAQDVAIFVATNMPANKPGTLTGDQYYAILAFDLKANGVDVSKMEIDPTTAAEIKLH